VKKGNVMAGKSETFIKLGLVFFISLLSFAIGTLVGKEYSERQYKLSKLEPRDKQHTESTREVASENGKQKLSDEEIAKLAEEFVTDENVEAAKEANHKEVPPIEGAASKMASNHDEQFDEMNDAALNAAQELIEKKSNPTERSVAAAEPTKKAAVTTKSAIPQAMPKNSAQENVGKYTVQVGSYLKEDEAKKRSEALRSKGYTAFYIPGVLEGKTWYRVNIGTYATQEEAKRANDKFAGDNAGQRGFVKEIVK
jgi:septal ring-binding cell division protein DamX